MTKANTITLMAIALGLMSVLLLFNEIVWVVFALCPFIFIMDVLDGYVARKYNCASEMGVQLDSLADAFNFGVMITLLVYMTNGKALVLAIAGIIFSLCAFWRLARFNVDAASGSGQLGYKGLPSTDAAAWLFILCAFIPAALPGRAWVFAIAMLVLAYLMVAVFHYNNKGIMTRALFIGIPSAALFFIYKALS